MEFLKAYVQRLTPEISQKSIDIISNNVKIKQYKKKEAIIEKNIHPDYFYLIESGIVRSYIVGKKESIHTKGFYTSGDVFSPLTSLISSNVNKEVYDCLEDTKVIELNWGKFKQQTASQPEIAAMYITFLEGALLTRELRINNLIALDATERYLKLRKTFPGIENMVAQYHIASYLSITPTQLSRIRKKMYSQ